MTINPIVEIVAGYLSRGKTITSVRPNNPICPTGIIVTTTSGWPHEHALGVADRPAFLELWREAVRLMTFDFIEMAAPDPLRIVKVIRTNEKVPLKKKAANRQG